MRENLRPWQKRVVRFILAAVVLVSGTGLFLSRSGGSSSVAMTALLVHIVLGLLAMVAVLVFVVPHAKEHLRRKPVIGLTGILVVALALFIAWTGLQLMLSRSALRPAWTLDAHGASGLGLFLLYALHRRWGSNPASWPRILAACVLVLAFGLGLRALDGTQVLEGDVAEAASVSDLESGNLFGLSLTRTEDGHYLDDAAVLADMNRCGECHARIVEDTLRSAHKHASMNNPFYRGTIQAMRKKYPLVDTKWCAGCHDPALLFTGRMDHEDLDFDSPEAMLGLTCMACHAIEPQSNLGNGDYVLKGRKIYSWERSNDPKVIAAHDVLLRAKPRDHVESLTPHNIRESSFCSTCHKAQVPPELNRWKWLRVQNEYDFHDNSGVSHGNVRSFYHPPEPKRCQDCHMPLVADPSDPSADGRGLVRSHLFAAANTALPFLRGDEAMIERQRQFLQNAVRVDITGIVLPPEGDPSKERGRLFAPARLAPPDVRPGEIVEAHVVVRNFGVGHPFPGGTIDSNEVWVEFEVSVDGKEPFFVSGRVDPETGRVDRWAEFYRAWVHDREGNRVVNRIGPDVFTRVYVKRIGPGTADVVRYRFRVPEGASEKVRIKTRLRYRKFMREYIDFLFPDNKTIRHPQMDGTMADVDLTKLPIVDMWEDSLELAVTEQGTRGAAPDPTTIVDPEPRRAAGDIDLPEDRTRINDLGIAYLLQEDPASALAMFQEVIRIDPSYADGWVNVARARSALKDDDGALEALAQAKTIKPGFAKARFFEGQIFQRRTLFTEAEIAYKEVLEGWPRERVATKELARVQWELGRPKDALATLERMIAIDPEDSEAWLLAISVYKELGDVNGVEEATRAYRRFKQDDDEPIRAGKARLADPALERMHRKIHVHVQPGLPGAAR